MLDLALIRDDPQRVDAGLARRGYPPAAERVLALDERHRALLTEIQQAQARRNEASKEIGKAKREGDEAQALIDEVSQLKARIGELEEESEKARKALDDELLALPNLPVEDVPDGADEEANRLERSVGTPPDVGFEPRQHFELGETLGGMDFEAAARMSGARFVVLKGAIARLERALGQFMLDLQTTEHGYQEVDTPYLVWDRALLGTGQLPKFAEDLYRAGEEHWLIPTAEVPLANLAREQILLEDALPMRVAALTPCFRSEAGAAGKDTRGMIRQHQFKKVELVSITRPEDSPNELERMVACAEEVLKRLEIAYRVMTLSTGDMGFAARKTYDIEVWLPGQQRYREISSCSDCGDFQARRMRMRCREKSERETRHPHTLNGSGLAVGRALIAVLETHQEADGTIAVPAALRPYMGGIERITP